MVLILYTTSVQGEMSLWKSNNMKISIKQHFSDYFRHHNLMQDNQNMFGVPKIKLYVFFYLQISIISGYIAL